MVNFYFIDSNIIISYCIPQDPFHDVATSFFAEKDNHRIFLLYSIQEEIYRKLEYEQIIFINKVLRSQPLLTFPKLQKILNRPKIQQGIQKSNFLRFLIYLCLNNNILEISYTKILDIFDKYMKDFRTRFNFLIKNWIKRPHMDQHHIIYKNTIYLRYYKLLKIHIHNTDAIHLSLACYEISERNRKKHMHHYYFYTNDREWIKKKLESHINIRNFSIKQIPYRQLAQKGFNIITQSFNLDKFEYVPDGL